MRSASFTAGLVVVLLLCVPAHALIVADSAEDVCTPDADPCVVTDTVEVVVGSVLDFGTRAVVVEGDGRIDFADGSSDLLAGSITLGGKGVLANRDGNGGYVTVEARRGCSGAATQPCRRDSDCGLGACGPESTCAHDPGRGCATNADCNVGTCDAGAGTLMLTAPWEARTAAPGSCSLFATDGVTVSAPVDVSGAVLESDGGSVDVSSGFADVAISGKISVSSGFDGYGGTLSIDAPGDVLLDGPVDCAGGDIDGGELVVFAGASIRMTGDIICSALGGAGAGGSIDLNADLDILFEGGGSADRMLVESAGHYSAEYGGGGYGGDIGVYAGRDIHVGEWIHIKSEGARTEEDGGDVDLDAGRDILVDGEVETRAEGIGGSGGYLTLGAGGRVSAGDAAVLSIDGGSVGYLDIAAEGDIDLGGKISMMGRQGGIGGDLSVFSRSDARLRGTLAANKEFNSLEIEACRVVLQDAALFSNNSDEGSNTLVAHESVRIESGATLKTKDSGANTIIYRDASKPPVLNGTVSPAPVLTLDADLVGCPVCGNGELDQGETCEDGDTVADEECTADCQLTACADSTVGGYPASDLCSDGIDCTVDACSLGAGGCTHAADSSACSDGDLCTIDSCVADKGCVHTPTGGPGCPGLCGDPSGNGLIQANDALMALKAAVGSIECALDLCDVNNSGVVQAADALAILRKAVGHPITLHCPPA